ncbi:MAG: YHYH domain-containing protein [Oscillospiraceae bacterium]
MKKLSIAVLCILLALLLPLSTLAHSGRTDSSGGHKDNKNASGLGYYHYHCGGNPPHLHSGGVCPYSSTSASAGTSTASSGARANAAAGSSSSASSSGSTTAGGAGLSAAAPKTTSEYPKAYDAEQAKEDSAAIRKIFDKFYSNSYVIVPIGHMSAPQTSVTVRTKADLGSLNTATLVFYNYNLAANTVKRIENPNYSFDAEGALTFTTSSNEGHVLITDSEWIKK